MSAASVRILVDGDFVDGGGSGLWPTVPGEGGLPLSCHLLLDNFTYERLEGGAACDASLRKTWLERQPREHLEKEFRPQPFEQLVKVLRAMGCDKDADEIALSKRWHAWKAKVGWSSEWPWYRKLQPLRVFLTKLAKPLWFPWDFLKKVAELVFVSWFVGYGYRVGQALIILLAFGCGFAWFYQQAFEQKAIVPSDEKIRNDPLASDCKNWSASACPKMAGKLMPFYPWVYSADVMIPVIGLGQKSAWEPADDKAIVLPILGRWVVYYAQLAETVLGWLASLLLVSFASGLIKKE